MTDFLLPPPFFLLPLLPTLFFSKNGGETRDSIIWSPSRPPLDPSLLCVSQNEEEAQRGSIVWSPWTTARSSPDPWTTARSPPDHNQSRFFSQNSIKQALNIFFWYKGVHPLWTAFSCKIWFGTYVWRTYVHSKYDFGFKFFL